MEVNLVFFSVARITQTPVLNIRTLGENSRESRNKKHPALH